MRLESHAAPACGTDPTGLAGLIEAIGDEMFGCRLWAFLHEACGAEYCTVYHLGAHAARMVATASLANREVAERQVRLYIQNQRWQRDPMIEHAREQLEGSNVVLVRRPTGTLPDIEYRTMLYDRADICDRVLMCGRSVNGMIGLSLLRSSQAGGFSGEDIGHVQAASTILMSIVGKHVRLGRQPRDPGLALRSLADIELCLAGAQAALTQREREVCARILYGVSSIGIALELGIGEETVMTYRKRAYQRLGIASQRELLLWYLDQWSAGAKGWMLSH